MRASAIRKKGAASFEELKPACQILILHEDFSAYSQAVEVCRRVMEQFASELDFDIKCWNLIELGDPNCARHAAKTAGAADIILLSMRTARCPVELDRWLDFFFVSRFRNEGVLALVLKNRDGPTQEIRQLTARLGQFAGSLSMDFIALCPDDAASMDALPPLITSGASGEARK